MRTTKYTVNNSRKHGKQEDMSGPPNLRLSCHVLKCSPPKIQPGIDGYAPALYRVGNHLRLILHLNTIKQNSKKD